MAEKHNVAMFIQKDGERVQVGWASPKNAEGVRTFERLAGYEGVSLKDVSFEDDEVANQEALEAEQAADEENQDSAPVQTENSEEDADPVDASVEIPGGEITEIDSEEDDEEAEFQRELEAEQARFAEQEQPQTRRELRNNEENN